jgi:hypothetical protein
VAKLDRSGGTSIEGRRIPRSMIVAVGGAVAVIGVVALVARGGDRPAPAAAATAAEEVADGEEELAAGEDQPDDEQEPSDEETGGEATAAGGAGADEDAIAVDVAAAAPAADEAAGEATPGPAGDRVAAIGATPAPAAAAGDDVAAIYRRLRSRDDHEALAAEFDLLRRGLPADYDRKTERRPERPSDSTEAHELTAEIVGDAIDVTWRVHFGEQLFVGGKINGHYDIGVSGGTLPAEVVRTFVPTPGDNVGSERVVTGIGPGKYVVSVFLWSERPSDRLQFSNNGPALFIEKR